MKYLCLVYGEEKDYRGHDRRWVHGLRSSASKCGAVSGFGGSGAGTYRSYGAGPNGKVAVRDGPFTETKECIAGFYLIEAADLDDAIQIASQMPPARVGSIEVRPVRELISTTGTRREL